MQCSTFRSAITPLVNLQALSLAYNKIQNDGFSLVCELATNCLRSLRQLDVACCFISSKSYSALTDLLQLAVTDAGATLTNSNGNASHSSTRSRLEEVLFQQNLFSYAQLQELHAAYGNRPDVKVSLNMPHLGIAYPLRYELRDFGIDSYHA